MSDRQDIKKFLQALVKMLDRMTEEEYDAFLRNELKLSFVHEPKKDIQAKGILEEDLQALSYQINELKNREQAQDLLRNDSRVRLKDDLIRLAKFMCVHVAKKDKREIIEEKIIEFVVGAKLRSEAIKSVNLKSGGA
jgi:hypothetical protein